MYITQKNLKIIQFNIHDVKNIAEEFKSDKKNMMQVTSTLDEATVNEIISKLMEKFNIDNITEALILITGVLQRGGSNLNAGNSVSFTYKKYTLSALDLQKVIRQVKKNATNRQLARSIADEIAQIAFELEIEGDLAGQMRFYYPDLTTEDAIWCSNFQTINPNCPEHVREWLVLNYQKRFNS